jgi:hypothetical protein
MADTKSLPYEASEGCPPGFHKRKSYSIGGKTIKSRCVRSTTVYDESSANFKKRVTRKMRRRTRSLSASKLGLNKVCPPGQILRKPYIRKFSNTIKREGFTAKRGNQLVKVKPTKDSTLVPAACIKDRGVKGTLKKGQLGIGPLRRGELIQYGYSYHLDTSTRHKALEKAIKKFGALGVFRKLDAVAKLALRQAPRAAQVFADDRDWVRDTHVIKAFKN